MKYSLLKEENYTQSQWTGGKTKELYIFPATSSYLERNFIWRLSSATIEKEETTFSKLPDYERVLMVLEGEVVLSYTGERVARLKELEQDRFDGQWVTKSFGEITDFNLMVRKGCEGYLDIINPQEHSKKYTATEKSSLAKTAHGLYCKEGYAVVTFNGESHMINPGQLLVLEYEEGEIPEYAIMGEGNIIRAQIFYDDMTGEVGPEIIPQEKATFDDFKKCIYLANVQFRWAKYMLKSLKTTWFDEALTDAIHKVEKVYLTTGVFLLGLVGTALLLVLNDAEVVVSVGAIAAWILVDCLLISPAIYMAFVPKPVAKHIKDINNLTPYEEKVREEQLKANPELEKVMKKYKNSGRNLGE